eukprot:1237579-Prorocentrum_lima.AAC.1
METPGAPSATPFAGGAGREEAKGDDELADVLPAIEKLHARLRFTEVQVHELNQHVWTNILRIAS